MSGYAELKDDDEMPMSSAGLTSAQAAAQMQKWGKNEIPEEKEPVRLSARWWDGGEHGTGTP